MAHAAQAINSNERRPLLPAALKHIRLELARSPHYPNGSAAHGYTFVAPLDANGHIDAELWRDYREHCGVIRFWGDEREIGKLIHKPGGAQHAEWAFHYGDSTLHEDEAGFRFSAHSFKEGEYVSINDPATGMHVFRVVYVRPSK